MGGIGPKMRDIWIKAFRGLNVREHVFSLDDGEFVTLNNFRRDKVELRSRGGTRNYLIKTVLNITTGIRSMARYRTSGATKKVLACATDGKVYGDSNDGQFALITTVTPDADGMVSLEQYRDTEFVLTDGSDITAYNVAADTPVHQPSMIPIPFGAGGALSKATGLAASTLQAKIYYWRATMDIQQGDDFLGETGATGDAATETYEYARVDLSGSTYYGVLDAILVSGGSGYSNGDILTVSGGTFTTAAKIYVALVDGSGTIVLAYLYDYGADQYSVKPTNPVSVTVGAATFTLLWQDITRAAVHFKRPSDTVVDAIPDYVARVNFYRSPPYDTTDPGADVNNEDTELYYVGSAEMADIRAAAEGDTIFTDTGQAPGKQISHGLYWYSMRPRYGVYHKGALWVGNVKVSDNGPAASYTSYPSRIYRSRNFANGPEPLAFQTAAPYLDIAPYTGEGITAMESWNGEIMLVTTPRTTHGITGGDDFISETLTRLQGYVLSPTVGCIAPKTMLNIETGLVWESHRGPVFFNGQGVQPLVNSDKIISLIEAIPDDRRRLMCSEYDSRNRIYRTYFTPAGGTVNSQAMCVHIPTGFWWLETPRAGVGAAMEINESDAAPKILLAYDDAGGAFTGTEYAIIVEADTGYKDLSKTGGAGYTCTFQTGYMDFGRAALNKDCYRISIEGEWTGNLAVDLFGDGIKDTTVDGATLSFPAPSGGKGLVTKAFIGDYKISAKRFSVRCVGSTANGPITITRIGLWLNPDNQWVEDTVQ